MDRDRVETFLDRFLALASGATTIGLLAVADRCGLLEWLGVNGSGTADAVADGAGLDRRYVLEILSGLTASGVLDYDPDTGVFHLPPEHALFVADESSPYFMGGWFDMLPTVLARVDEVAVAARDGGGVPFEDFGPGLVRGIDRGNGPSQRVFLVARWLPAVPGLVDRLESGIEVADVGCGAGTAAIEMAAAFPRSHVHGFDVSSVSLRTAKERGEHMSNLSFEEAAVEDIPVHPPYGLVTSFDVIHDLADPAAGLRRIRESLTVDGQYLMMEPNASTRLEENLDDRGSLLYGISTLHCMTQSLARGGAGLGAVWGRETAEVYASEAGFSRFTPLDSISNRFSAFYLLEP